MDKPFLKSDEHMLDVLDKMIPNIDSPQSRAMKKLVNAARKKDPLAWIKILEEYDSKYSGIMYPITSLLLSTEKTELTVAMIQLITIMAIIEETLSPSNSTTNLDSESSEEDADREREFVKLEKEFNEKNIPPNTNAN